MLSLEEILKKVRRLEIKTRGLSNHIFAGEYHTAFKGRGMSFSEVREYQFGDDVRAIDWNVTARFHTPYIKVFEEERELTVMLLIDVSRSSGFGTIYASKKDLMTEIAAVLAFSATRNNDKVGLLLFSDVIEKFIPPKKGRSHILHLIRELLGYEARSAATDIDGALRYFSNVIKKRSIVFLMSDFIAPPVYEKNLRIAARKHDLIGIRVSDPRDENLPTVGLLPLRDAESGATFLMDTASKTMRRRYSLQYVQQLEQCKQIFRNSGTDLLLLSTDQHRYPYHRELMRFFQKRGVPAIF